jgi:hypothetical protein
MQPHADVDSRVNARRISERLVLQTLALFPENRRSKINLDYQFFAVSHSICARCFCYSLSLPPPQPLAPNGLS